MKDYQIYNSAIEDVLDEFNDWWKRGELTASLVKRIKKLKRSQNTRKVTKC